MTVRPSSAGRHAKPRRGLMLFLSVTQRFRQSGLTAVTNGVLGTAWRTKPGPARARPRRHNDAAAGKFAIEVTQLVAAIVHRRPQVVAQAVVDRQLRAGPPVVLGVEGRSWSCTDSRRARAGCNR